VGHEVLVLLTDVSSELVRLMPLIPTHMYLYLILSRVELYSSTKELIAVLVISEQFKTCLSRRLKELSGVLPSL
jgi:hypothetical protein